MHIINIHTDTRKLFQCEICEKCFRNKCELKEHTEMTHKENEISKCEVPMSKRLF